MQMHSLLTRVVRGLAQRGVVVDEDTLAGRTTTRAPSGSDAEVAEATALYGAILREVSEIDAIGGEVKSVDLGLVDFWSYLDGHAEVLLCWKLGEHHVAWYHHPESGFAGRRPVSGHTFSERHGTGSA